MMRWLLFFLALLVAAPAPSAYHLERAGVATKVGKEGLQVTPDADWNRLGAKLGRNAESWTFDGQSLNDLTFYAGIKNDKTLFREVDKRERPLPRFKATMLPPDLVQLFEGSYRVAAGTGLFSVDTVEPATFLGAPGVRFRYTFLLQGEEVKRLGEAVAAVVGSKLYLISFEAPAIHYFDRDVPRFRALAASARLAGGK